ncbi:MAG: hypothetical protein EOO07_08330 [Chitinophagaceae bacterium]|nr:MAG: hypothetical protein EOO07_08330 [Chitinophagaceae bacterium]
MDPTTPARVTSGYLEFKIDYTKNLAPNNDSWKLVKNWSYGVSPAKDGEFTRLINTTTLSNGRVYSFVQSAIPKKKELVELKLASGERLQYHRAIICTGHHWPKTYEGDVPQYFDSPYPPAKLKKVANYPVAIRGASLTAIDAIRTLARVNGSYSKDKDGMLNYKVNEENPEFRLVLHSLSGLLPAIRFHLEDSMLGKDTLYSPEEVTAIREANEGFVPLDMVFEEKFLKPLAAHDPEFFNKIDAQDLSIEKFVDQMLSFREDIDSFELFKAEYRQAEKSIKRRESVYWKEMLGALSYTMNYPAKYFSAEDMLRLKKTLMPLISLVIAFVPQSSAEEMLALHQAGVLDLLAVGAQSKVVPNPTGGITYHYKDAAGKQHAVDYAMFVDCIGQPHLPFDAFPYEGLRQNDVIAPAKLNFRSNEVAIQMKQENVMIGCWENGTYYLKVPGIAINDHFQVLDAYNAFNPRIYVMAVPLIGGYNPDYSGLDFSETAATAIAATLSEII